MCYYAEWDERFQQSAKETRISKETAGTVIPPAIQESPPGETAVTAEPSKKEVAELREFAI